jgi:hypothetical protein
MTSLDGRVRRTSCSSATLVIVVAVATLAAGCSGDTHSSSSTTTSRPVGVGPSYAVPATLEPLTIDPQARVVHDNEVIALASHAGRLFAATDQWKYPGANAAGQVLVKDSSTAPWRVFEQTQSIRVQALDSFALPANQGLSGGHSLLVTQAIVNGRSEIQWLLDGANAFSAADTFALASTGVDVRSFGAHVDDGVWSVYAGANPTGILRGTWSPASHTLVFDSTPELTAAPPGSKGLKTQKVTGFADCGGALYVSINTNLYRRNDGTLPAGVARWQLVYQASPVGPHNSGLRGLSCAEHAGGPSLLVSTEGNGNVYRFDHLPHGRVASGAPRFQPVLEFSPIPAIRQMLATQGTAVPPSGNGSIPYVIAAYNNIETTSIDGTPQQLFGFEWSYLGGCPTSRSCGPTNETGAVTFDAAACFAVRTDHGPRPSYVLRCLSGPDFTPTGTATKPIRSRQAFVSIRTIKQSPFANDELYFGGYDCNFYPADGTAWTAHASLSALHLGDASPKKGP